jgi:hypothetical protein
MNLPPDKEMQSRLRALVEGLLLTPWPDLAPWPDCVFDEDYDRPSLRAILAFARQHRQLEGVVLEERVNRGDFNARRELASVLWYVEVMVLYLN